MDLNKKIEAIRQKPEHIRLRYVWGAVAISMIFIIIIWIFSMGESIKGIKSDSQNFPDIKQSLEQMQTVKNSIPSINDLMANPPANNQATPQNGQDLGNEGIQNQPPDENNPAAASPENNPANNINQ